MCVCFFSVWQGFRISMSFYCFDYIIFVFFFFFFLVMVATEDEMKSVGLPLEARDFCAHHLIDYQVCRMDKFPWVFRCAHEKHQYLNCEYEEYKYFVEWLFWNIDWNEEKHYEKYLNKKNLSWNIISFRFANRLLFHFSYILRMKEYERERRLLQRQKRKESLTVES